MTAWTRTGQSFLLPNYQIISLFKTADLAAIKKQCPVYCLEEEGESVEKQNTSSIMLQPKAYSFLKSFGTGASLLLYKSSPKVEKICQELSINILSSPSWIRDPFEDKKEFRVLGKKAGLKLIPGETLLIDDLNKKRFKHLVKKYGPELVFQLPDYKVGGGIGTFFIRQRADWREFLGFVDRRRKKGKKLVWLNITKFIKGTTASISACVTKQGIICGLVQIQLVDVEEARAFKARSGVWVGHDWGWKSFSPKVQQKAEKIAKTLGAFMHKKGYKGVFGIDLAIDEQDEVWPVECNARYTAAFPLYSMMQSLNNEPNFDTFHLLEHLKIDYEFDLKALQKVYYQPKQAAHLVMHNQERKWVRVDGDLKAGVYKYIKEKLIWQRPGFSLQDLKDEDEFCLCDRAAIKGRVLKPGERLVRVLFKTKIALSCNRLNTWASGVCQAVYKEYKLKVIPSRTVK